MEKFHYEMLPLYETGRGDLPILRTRGLWRSYPDDELYHHRLPQHDQTGVKSLVVADTVFCGVCKPQPEPLETPYLD